MVLLDGAAAPEERHEEDDAAHHHQQHRRVEELRIRKNRGGEGNSRRETFLAGVWLKGTAINTLISFDFRDLS